MKKIIIIICLIFWIQNSFAQEFCTHWVSYPLPNDSSEVLFRKTFTTQHRPTQALITFASCGKLKVYVNERNITKDLLFENPNNTYIVSRTIDISRFLNAEQNTIAVWYAPVPGMPISKQLSLEYYGKDIKGKFFYHKADKSWWCKTLRGSFNSSTTEQYDSRFYHFDWMSPEYKSEHWIHPTGSFATEKSYPIISNPLPTSSYPLTHIIFPVNHYEDSLGIHYDFGRPFYGSIRLTLREASKGETIKIDNYLYICNGEMDEQAFRRFTSEQKRIITINGGKYFNIKQINNIEGLEYQHNVKESFSY